MFDDTGGFVQPELRQVVRGMEAWLRDQGFPCGLQGNEAAVAGLSRCMLWISRWSNRDPGVVGRMYLGCFFLGFIIYDSDSESKSDQNRSGLELLSLTLTDPHVHKCGWRGVWRTSPHLPGMKSQSGGWIKQVFWFTSHSIPFFLVNMAGLDRSGRFAEILCLFQNTIHPSPVTSLKKTRVISFTAPDYFRLESNDRSPPALVSTLRFCFWTLPVPRRSSNFETHPYVTSCPGSIPMFCERKETMFDDAILMFGGKSWSLPVKSILQLSG